MCTARVRTICSARPVSSGASHSPSSSRTSRASTGICAVRCRHDDAGSSQSGSNGSGYSAVTSVQVHSSWDGQPAVRATVTSEARSMGQSGCCRCRSTAASCGPDRGRTLRYMGVGQAALRRLDLPVDRHSHPARPGACRRAWAWNWASTFHRITTKCRCTNDDADSSSEQLRVVGLQLLRGVRVQLVLQPHLVQRGVRRDHPGEDLDAGHQFRGGAPPGEQLPERLLRAVHERVAVQPLDGAVHPERGRQVRRPHRPRRGTPPPAARVGTPTSTARPPRPASPGTRSTPAARRGVPPGSRRPRWG